MSTGNKFNRGDVVLLPISFVSGVGTKVRPAVIVQNVGLNARLNSTIVAIITSTNTRSRFEPTQLLIDIMTEEKQKRKGDAAHCFGGLGLLESVDPTTTTKMPGWNLLSCDQSSGCALDVNA